MPPLPAVPGVVRTAVEGTIAGSPFANIFHWLMDTTSGITNAQATTIANSVYSHYATMISGLMGTDIIATACFATDLTSSSGGVGSAAGSSAGGNLPGGIPASTSVLVKHIISRRYRGGHPRTYLPPMSHVSLLDEKNWSGSSTANMQSAWDTFVSGVLGTSVSGNTIDAHVNVSYHSGHALRPTPVIDNISGSVVEQPYATQRRRLGR